MNDQQLQITSQIWERKRKDTLNLSTSKSDFNNHMQKIFQWKNDTKFNRIIKKI
jgi:hypothetical protein